jgi:acyl-CoA synthetase (AMP-forming)/AMP-acid ligase II
LAFPKTGEALKHCVKTSVTKKEDIISFAEVSSYKIPHCIEFRDQLPLSPVGVLRRGAE